ncbi:MAG TPA: radical SAM protein [Gemmatimonadota bacterium]|nr:radical SAM protein [Gemmatimonadota bacterium]
MIKVNTQVVDTVPESQREALRSSGATTQAERGPGEFDTRAFTVPDRTLDPRGQAKPGLAKKAVKCLDWALCKVAAIAFDSIQVFNRYRPNPSFTPRWSDKPLLKSWEKSKPRLGWPRETDSLCPQCVVEARKRIIEGEEDYQVLINEKVGEIKAQVVERDGQIWMIKECPEHGRFEDMMAIDARFLEWIESNFPGRDLRAHNDGKLHDHGSSTIKHGRGAVLTVDLTNRCNMMCDPCFMDANQVGFVHELEWEEIKEILDNALQIKPRRQMSIQFSGGEPTLSPHFVRAIKYCRDIGYNSVQCASNGIEFAKSFEFTEECAKAGLRFCYLQFDGIGNDANSHRKVGNLFDVKLKAIDHLYKAGVQVILVTTLVNSVNNDQVGPIIRFALDNPKKVAFIAFQPVSFTGRDDEITAERRMRQRYTLSHMARDVKDQLGISEPLRDWFPLSLMGTFSDLADMVHGPQAEWGQVSCGCHPNCGVGTALMVNKHTREFAPVPQFLDIPQLAADFRKVTDAARGKFFSNLMIGLALLKNYKPFSGPPSLTLIDILKKFDKSYGLTGHDYGSLDHEGAWERRKDPWNFLFIAGMWFQDLFNYDFRRTEMCIIPYATQEGEISFCAYNTGHGWRNILENMHKSATVAEWYKEHGRHEIFAGGKEVPLANYEHALIVNEEDAARVRDRGEGPQNAHEERLAAKKAAREAAMVREYYEQMVLKRKAASQESLVQIEL